MDDWEAIVDKYEEPVEPRSFVKACQTAKALLEQDFAPFEIDWLVDTLLLKPVNLLTTVASKCSDDAWSQSIGDAFKLLSELIMKHPDHASPHYENIVKLCNLSYDARTRQHALHCLTCIVRHSEIGAANHLRYVHALEEDSTCKATMSELVGAICEEHPDIVSEDVTTIWRVYLNLLDSTKFSDTVVRSVLLGILGLFKIFCMDLPTAELNSFYDKLDSCKEKYRCKEVYLTILERHAGLFRERLSADASARKLLWTWLATQASPQIRPALLAVYTAIRDTVDQTTLRSVVASEVQSYVKHARAHVRFTAARVLYACSAHLQECASTYALADAPVLLHVLAAGPLNYDHVEAIQWCIETYTAQDDKILKMAIMFHDHIPVKHRKQIVAYGILEAPSDVRTELVTFLINETCQSYKDNGHLNKYMPLWRSLFDTVNYTDTVVMTRCCLVLDAIMDYLVYNLECFLENAGNDSEELPDKLRYVLVVSSQIIPLLEMVDEDREHCLRALQLLHDLRVVCSSAVSAVFGAIRAIALYLGDYDVISDDRLPVRIDNCNNDADLYESCLALILTPVGSVRDIPSLLTALQITFARRDVEPDMLSRSVRTLESLIMTQREKLDDKELNDAINLVERMYHRIDVKVKEGRSLRRDVLMFLGKYGTGSDVNNNSDDEVIAHLKSSLMLAIPDPREGITDKVNLQSILWLALKYEDPKALRVLIEILCANALGRALTPCERRALCRALYALALAGAGAQHTPEALAKCGETAIPILLQSVCRERRPGVRCAALGWLAHSRSYSHASLLAIAQQAAACMDPASTTKAIGLDIAQMLISALKDENTLVKTVLPELIVQISNTRELYAETAFKNATELLIDKIELFENEILKSITIDLLKVLCSSQNGGTSHGMADIRIMRKFTKMTVEFLKRLGECKGNYSFDVVDDIFMIVEKKVVEFSRLFYVLSVVKEVFEFNTDMCRNILLREGNYITNILFDDGQSQSQDSLDCLHLEAILKFCTVYAEVLLELHYEGTLKLLSRILTKLHPYQIELHRASIFTCLTKCKEILKSTPRILVTSFENWCRKLPLKDICGNLQRYKFSKEDMALVKSLKLMLECFDITDPGFGDLNKHTQEWLHCVQLLQESDYIERNVSKLPYLTDILHVSFRFLTVTDVKSVILGDGEAFCRIFMPALFRYFVRQPYLLMDHDLEKFCVLLNDIVRYYVRKCKLEEYCDLILDLVDKLWPTYESVCNFKQKHSLLVDILSLPKKLLPESNPICWVVDSIQSDEWSCELKAKLIGVLPASEAYSDTWQWFLGQVPARLGDACGDAGLMLRALLDAMLAADCSLLDRLCQLVSGDTEKGWWDDAIDACVVTLASRNDITIYETVYKQCWDGLSLGVCNRLMVPLLRCSNASVCEEFFSSILKDLLAMLKKKPRGATAHYIYHKAVVDYLRTLILLKVAFEKIPRAHIESPNSALYSRMSAEVRDNMFYLAKTVAMYCVQLEKVVVCPAGADQKLKNNCLLFQCENYNCLTAAIFCREPKDSKFYDLIYNEAAWSRIVDPGITYNLPLKAQWQQKRTVKQAVGVELSSDSPLLGRSLTRTSTTTRTRTFLHTLSENPLDFDLQLPLDEQDETHELSVSESSVNEHACAATLTAATSRVCHLPVSSWRNCLAAALRSHLHHNVKLLLAQVICNCSEDLKDHASVLRPALLEMIVQTSRDEAGGTLNGLHVQILDTVIQWRVETNELESDAIDNLNVTIERLIATCIRNARRQEIVNNLIEKMNSLLEMYGTVVNIGWTCFQDYMEAPNTSAPKTYLQILKNITNRKIHIPELLPNLMQSLESRQDRNSSLANLANRVDLGQLAQLFGRALAAAPVSTKFEMLKRYRNVLEKNKSDVSEYIKLLYNAQVEFSEVCDGVHFRRVTDLARKVVGRNKTKCLEILSMYISKASRDEEITAMFETIEISELMLQGDEIVLDLVMNGLPVMEEQLKRRVILQCVEHCSHSVGKVRKAALGVLLKAFEGLIVPSAEESNPKRPAKLNSPLLRDVGFNKPLAAFGLGLVCEPDAGDLRDAVSRHLASAGLVKRFCETFITVVHLPVLHAARNEKHLSGCVYALLDMFFKDLRENEAFKRALLRDQPLESTSSVTTVRTVASTTGSRLASNQDNPTTEEIKSVDDVLGSLLQFAKSSPEAASALCLQVMSALKSRTGSGFDFAAAMSELLVPMLGHVSDLTPFLVEACRLFVDECCHINGFKETVDALLKTAKGTEGQYLVQALNEDVVIRCPGLDYFILGKMNHESEDWDMTDLAKHFSLEDLVASFGMLSNWEDLTVQQRKSVQSSLPPLWVDTDTYKVELDGWSATSSNSWFDKMASVYSKESYLSLKWLSELRRWPRSLFSMSATVEAIQLEQMQEDSIDDVLENLRCEIRPTDCLAEWAVRILTRAAYFEKGMEEYRTIETNSKKLFLSHALRWCVSANERELPSQVLRCVTSFIKEETSTLPWLSQELIAMRKLALRSNNKDRLCKILQRAETEGALVSQGAPLEDIIEMNHLTLLLHRDLNSLTKEKLKYTLNNTQQQHIKASEGALVQGRNKQVLKSMVELAIMHYDGLWEGVYDSDEQNTILTDISSAIDLARSLNLNLKYSNLLDVILNRLSDFTGDKLSDEATAAVLGTMETLIHEMDDFAKDEIKRNRSKFSTQRSSELIAKLDREEVETSKFKKCLQLVADAEYALKQYCRGLRGALERNDGVEWSQIFNRMKEKIFENPYAGPDYQVLSKYQTVLYNISDFEHMDKTSAKQTLQRLINELSSNRQTLRLSQLCPTLAQVIVVRGSETDDCLSRLLMLPRGVHVLKFEEQVSVFTESVRRPVVVTVRLSDGNARPLLVKGGERLRLDAAALRLLRGLPLPAQQHYQVTPLSEDCGLIEYLEDHERLRVLISSKYDLDGILTCVSRAADDELILMPREDCIEEFEQICSKLPSHALRSVIEMRSSCIEDFIRKKLQFEESLSVMTFVTWLLGVGDRHLDNILMSLRHGSVRAVDWNCTLRHGRAELPPARLTRNLLALCRPTVLESRLQKLTAASRDSHRLLLPVLQVSFRWMENEVENELADVSDLLRGEALPHQVSQRAVLRSARKYSYKYSQLLEHIFEDYPQRDKYTVEEQVSNLLRHCTDPQILGVTRSNWEPWI